MDGFEGGWPEILGTGSEKDLMMSVELGTVVVIMSVLEGL